MGANNIFSSRLSNELRFNYTSNQVQSVISSVAQGGNTPQNFATLLSVPLPKSTISINLDPSGISLIQMPTDDLQRQWNIVDTVSYSRGAHQLKVGVDYRRLTPADVSGNPEFIYFFNAEPSIESGNIDLGITFNANQQYQVYTNFSTFAQDEWKVTHRLTLSLGLRWDVNPAPWRLPRERCHIPLREPI